MTVDPLLISLPIADRPRSLSFYQGVLGLDAEGEPAEDGVPEPLLLVLNDHARLMLVPTGGFGWVIGGHQVAEPGTSECILGVSTDGPEAVDALVERAIAAGGSVVTAPGQQPWGYAGAFTDPDGHVWSVTAAPQR